MRPLSELKVGEQGYAIRFIDDVLALKLYEMGCIPGEYLRVEMIAPLGDPMTININGNLVSMRKHVAACVMIDVRPESLN